MFGRHAHFFRSIFGYLRLQVLECSSPTLVLALAGVVVTPDPSIERTPSRRPRLPAVAAHVAAVFEDDGQTGYFYALDLSSEIQPIDRFVLVQDRPRVDR